MKNIVNGLKNILYKLIICYISIQYVHAQDITYALDFISVPKYGSINSECVYADVLNHCKQSHHGDQDGRYTNVHETAHGIHNELRNIYRKNLKTSVNVFYCLNGKGVIVKDPNIKMRHINRYVPTNLRSSRYKVYLVDQVKYWDDTPTYNLDEWNCFILGASCSVDDYSSN